MYLLDYRKAHDQTWQCYGWLSCWLHTTLYVAGIVSGNITLLKGSDMATIKPTIKTTLASINLHETIIFAISKNNVHLMKIYLSKFYMGDHLISTNKIMSMEILDNTGIII